MGARHPVTDKREPFQDQFSDSKGGGTWFMSCLHALGNLTVSCPMLLTGVSA